MQVDFGSKKLFAYEGSDFFHDYLVATSRYAIKSARSLGFFKPAKTILVPGIYFLGSSKYSKSVSSDQVIPLDLLASV